MRRVVPNERGWRLLLAVILDPPGWIPAWAMTVVLLLVARRAAGHGDPLMVLDRLAGVYQATLAIWLGYRGIGLMVRVVAERLGLARQPVEGRDGVAE